jgi:hypothetical protein
MLTSRAAPPRFRWLGQGRRWPLVLPLLMVLVSGCAQPGAGLSHAAASATSVPSATVTVGPNDGGRTVGLKVGERLIIQLSSRTSPSRLRPAWTLRAPPAGVLRRVQGNSDATEVVFVADQLGTVRLVLVKRYGCDPPLRCPAAGPLSSESERMRPPLERPTATITVRVQ